MLYKNLNSSITPPDATTEYLLTNINFIFHTWRKTPCYLIDPDLMDFLYPPQKRLSINEECAREILDRPFHDFHEILMTWEHLPQKCLTEKHSYIVATGIYMQQLGSHESEEIRTITGHDLQRGPMIFLCPERIYSWAGKVQEYLPIPALEEISIVLFVKVYLHELAHAFMDGGQSSGNYPGLFIEESLANAMAFSCFRKPRETAILKTAISMQPPEYRGFDTWLGDEWRSGSHRDWGNIWRNYHRQQSLPTDVTFPRFVELSPTVPGMGDMRSRYTRRRHLQDALVKQPDFPRLFWGIIAAVIFKQVIGIE